MRSVCYEVYHKSNTHPEPEVRGLSFDDFASLVYGTGTSDWYWPMDVPAASDVAWIVRAELEGPGS